MTAEPRDVEEIRGLHGSSGCKAVLHGDELGDFYECACGWRSDAGTGVAIARTRLAAADRENAELREEVERLQRRLFPGQGESYANEVERQRVVIDQMATIAKTATAERDDLRAQLAAAQAQLAEARSESSWLSDVRDSFELVLERERERLEAAEARLEAVLAIAQKWACDHIGFDEITAALSAAPQPEPVPWDQPLPAMSPEEFRRERAGRWTYPEPPTSDEPARCELCDMGPTAVHHNDSNAKGFHPFWPAASGTPDGGS